ncbi:nucleotidyltransferase [Nannocystis sp. RBIL2]|uniref:SMODS domain-containing nucleotidyltransferase n=1 Tax=Nannocystis sp. RBIL2 TaxID=2996788 RepID=UPI0022707D19|nr:nucleotidyltransferase [Nannocystis sp. RBIL2]
MTQAFQEFLSSLELTETQRSDASVQHTYLRSALQKELDVEDNFLSGSYARKTAIRPLHDIDVFLVLKDCKAHNPRSAPSTVLETIQSVLEKTYPKKTAVVQSRSVNIAFTGTEIAYDVVPAFGDGDAYQIPDRDTNKWIATDPRIHADLATSANETANKRLKPLLKAIKHANHKHGKLARSFHLEVLSWNVQSVAEGSYLDGLIELLAGLQGSICDKCPDPAGLGPDIQPELSRCLKTQKWLSDMTSLARDAGRMAADGRTGEAHAKLFELFGERWPERGKAAAQVASAIISSVRSSGVDGSGTRWG